jgi:hypothetical protein
MKVADLNATMVKYMEIRTKRLALDKQSSALKAEEDMLRGVVLREVMGRGDAVVYEPKALGIKAEIKMRAYADVTNWDELYAHIQATGEFDLLQKRVTITAARERWEMGKIVPGVVQSQEPEVIIGKTK